MNKILLYLPILIILTIIPYNFVFAEPTLRVTDCIQSYHQIRYNIYADGFLPNTRLLVQTYYPGAERPNGDSSNTNSEGSWTFEGAGYGSSAGIINGTYRFEAFNVDRNHNMLPNSPYATTELVAPCPFVSTPPDTEVYASVNNNQIQSGDSTSSASVHFSYYIRNHFAPYAQFDCKLDDQPYQDCTVERCESPGSCIPNSLEYGEIDYVSLEPGLHTFSVRATDDADNTDPTPAEFTWTITKPTADAGENQIVESNDLVSLDGSNSFDIDNSTLSYQWEQIDDPVVILSDSRSSNPTFTAPETIEQSNLIFQLVVTNEEDTRSEPDEVTITVKPTPVTSKPIADAGPDQSVNSDDVVQLNGGNSSVSDGSSLIYQWNQTAGPEVTLSDSTSSNPTFTAPEVNEQTDLTFQLTVTNNEDTTSEPDEVTITVNPVATPPPEEEPRTISDLIKGIILNPLDVTNSVDSANEIRDILTDNDRGNDQLVCDLIDSEDEHTYNIRQLLNC